MNGITFLKTYEEVATTTWGWSWGGLFFSLIALGVLVLAIYTCIEDKNLDCLPSGLFCMAIIGLIATMFFATGTKIYETRHDVYLSGEINMSEFTQKYEVIKQDGLVFTITDIDTIEGE